MKSTILFAFCLLILLIGCNVAAQEDFPRVNWFDDFLGVKLHPGYVISQAGTGIVKMSERQVGGSVLLAALGYGSGAARLRLGEEPITGAYDALHFSAKKNLIYKTRVYLNRATDTQVTIGFVGYHDPENVLALVVGAAEGGPDWGFQVVNSGHGQQIPTGFLHTPGCWFTVKIETVWGETPVARVYINDELRAEVKGGDVPDGGLCPEFQIWNKPLDGAYSQPTMWVDYISVSQDR